MQQAEDFRAESLALAAILDPLAEDDFRAETQFKGWSINDVLGHLHMFNVAADLTLESGRKFGAFFQPIAEGISRGQTLLQTQSGFLGNLKGRALLTIWQDCAHKLADHYAQADPKARLKWAGPDMSARSSITARQMETWAHGQEIFDLLGVERAEGDRIKNIVHLGVNTFGWSFVNRGLDVPDPAPHLKLVAPSGVVWDWNEATADNPITGTAVDFARVVTQTRNIDDTALMTVGKTATDWMKIAQCFAGAPETPPSAGLRHRVEPQPVHG